MHTTQTKAAGLGTRAASGNTISNRSYDNTTHSCLDHRSLPSLTALALLLASWLIGGAQ